MKIIIKGRLDGLNEYTLANRNNRFGGAKMKGNNEMLISAQLPKLEEPITGKVFIVFCWYEANSRRDPDNIAFAKKFILDAMVRRHILKGDSQRYIYGFHDMFAIDPDNPRVEVIIREVRKQ